MKYTNFINYSTYSNGLGLLKLEDIIRINKENNSDHAVLTDHMTCLAFPEFNDACLKNNLKPIFGLSVSIQGEQGNLILIARNNEGIQSLRNIVTHQQFDENNIGFTTWEDLSKLSHDLVVIAGNKNSILNSAYENGKIDNAIHNLVNKFPSKNNNNILFDVQNRVDLPNTLENIIFKKANEFRINIISTSTNRVLNPKHIPLLKQKLITQISSKETNLNWKEFNLTDDDFAKTSSFMYANFHSEHQKVFTENTIKFANSIKDCSIFKDPSFPSPNDKNLRAELRALWPEFSKNIPKDKHTIYKKRIQDELSIIENLKLEDYFKTYQIMAEHARENDVAYAIRGSGSSSLIVHMLGISSIDPVKNGLLFERFLNYKRAQAGALPDIDFDTSNQIEITSKLSSVFGQEYIATLTNTDSIQKSNVSLNMVDSALSNHANIENMNNLKNSLKEIFSVITLGKYGKPLSQEMESNWKLQKIYKEKKEIKYLVDSALILEKQITNHKRNGASVIVSSKKINDQLSVKTDENALVKNVAEISKGFAESVGFIKLDVLSNHFVGNNLNAYKKLGLENELNQEEYNDPKVFELFKNGHLHSLFQMTKLGMNLSKEMQPESFSDIVVLLGLIRPGVPSEEISSFIETKNKKKPINFEIKELDNILSDTYGIIIFEEQLMKISQEVGNFSPDESDELRRTIKNKDKDKLSIIRKHFVKRGLKKNSNYSEKQLNEVFDKIERKADGYMFNQAHAIVYGDICYKQAKIKANYPGEYMNFYFDKNDEEKRTLYMEEAINRGIYFNAPNINKSSSVTTTASSASKDVKTLGITPSISSIVGKEFADIILDERRIDPFEGVFDFTSRIINRSLGNENLTVFDIEIEDKSPRLSLINKNISSLISVGFLDQFAADSTVDSIVEFRNQALASLEKAIILTLNPNIQGDFEFEKPLSYISLEKFIEIEQKSFGISPLETFKNSPIKKNDIEKKRNKKGSLYDLI